MKRVFVAILCLSAVAVAGFVAYRVYKISKESRAIRQAREFIAKSDAPNAVLSLRQALQTNPNNLEACRLMAEYSELGRSPQAVLWRSRIVELEPGSLSNRIDLVRVAIANDDLATAQRALSGVAEGDRKTVAYQRAAGAANLAGGSLEAAEANFAEAARLEPSSPLSQLNLAMLRIHKRDATVAEQARTTLIALTNQPTIGSEALRQLTQDALRRTNLAAALAFSTVLVSGTNSGFGDRMRHLELLRATTNQYEVAYLGRLQRESTNQPARAFDVARWLLLSGRVPAAMAWIESLPPGTRTNLPVPMVEADCYMATKNWAALGSKLENQTWYDVDCLRLACRARSFREQGIVTRFKTEWQAALKATAGRRDVLIQLLNTVTTWKWDQEQEDVLWALVNRYPGEEIAARLLAERLTRAGNTRGLMSLYGVLADYSRTNLVVLNNLAMTAMLLEAWERKPHELALEVYTKAGTNASYAGTYAYSLLIQQRAKEALEVFEKLTAAEREEPSVAAYYGLTLQAAKQSEAAQRYLRLAQKAKLLPEESKMIERALGRN